MTGSAGSLDGSPGCAIAGAAVTNVTTRTEAQRRTVFTLETEAQAEAELPRATQCIVPVRREDSPEVSTVRVVVRVGEVRRIGDVEPFRPELQLVPVRQLERAEQAQV